MNVARLPDIFVPTPYPGYFWDIETNTLYSIKIAGVLRKLPLKPSFNFHKNRYIPEGYDICHKGRKRRLSLDRLMKLSALESDHIIPVLKS